MTIINVDVENKIIELEVLRISGTIEPEWSAIQNKPQIEEHMADVSKHYLMADISIQESQVYNLDKYTQAEINYLLDQKAWLGHNHDGRYYTETEIDTLFTPTSGLSTVALSGLHSDLLDAGAYNHSAIDGHIDDLTLHYTQGSIQILEFQVTDLDKYAKNQVDTLLLTKADESDLVNHIGNLAIHFSEASIDHANILNIGLNSHASIDSHISNSTIHYNQSSISITESQISDLDKYTQSEVDTLLLGKSDTTHNHDLIYAALSHAHDDRYYTESEVDSLILGVVFWDRDAVNGYIYPKTLTDKLGIGTATPSYKLTVNGDIALSQTGQYFYFVDDSSKIGRTAADSDFVMYGSTGIKMYTYTAPSWVQSLTVDTNGDTGLGTETPRRQLDVLDATNPQLRLTHTDGSVYTDFQTTSSGHLYINPSGGNVGIGTATPGQALDVFNGRVRIREYGTASNDYAVLEFGNALYDLVGGFFLCGSGATGYAGANSMNIFNIRAYPLALGTSNLVRLYIEADGDIGINTTTPRAKVDILDASNPQLRLTHTDGSVYADLQTDGNGHLSIAPSGGSVIIPNLPTSDPAIAGALWNNSGVINISAG